MRVSNIQRCRRALIVGAASTLAAPPRLARAQQPRVRKIGYLSVLSDAPPGNPYQLVRIDELRQLGWIEGQNYVFESRYANGDYSRLDALVRELVAQGVEVLIAAGDPEVFAAIRAAPALPVVVRVAADPVGDGYAKSLREPGGNVTGMVWSQNIDGLQRGAQFLKEFVPEMKRSGGILDPRISGLNPYREGFAAAARRLGFTHEVVEVTAPEGFEAAFASLVALRVQAVLVYSSPLFFQERRRIVGLARTHRLPDLYAFPGFVEIGGLMSYSPDILDMFRRAMHHVDKILRGAKPGDLPIEQPLKYDLAINLKTARELGRPVPEALRVQAARFVE